MKAYVALTANELRLAFRDKQVLFFNYAFPLILGDTVTPWEWEGYTPAYIEQSRKQQ